MAFFSNTTLFSGLWEITGEKDSGRGADVVGEQHSIVRGNKKTQTHNELGPFKDLDFLE